MYFTIYKTTNLINDKIYIGKHQTLDPNDDYLGSGKWLNYSIDKHGRENFVKEVLYIFDNEEDMNSKEAELVDEKFCLRENTYNECPGGKGGWGYINRNKEFFVAKSINTWVSKPEEEKLIINRKKSNPGSKNGMFGANRSGENNPRYGAIIKGTQTALKISKANSGKHPSAEARKKMSKAQTKRWTNELREERSAKYKEKGIKPPSPKGMLWWNDGIIQIRSKSDPKGNFIRGRLKRG